MTTELFFVKPVSGAFTGSIEGDRVGAVSFFGSASFAPQAGAAQTATSASHAVQADNAANADTASFVTASVIVGPVASASHADNANFATLATSASHAVQADNAQTSVTASHALDFDGDVSASQVLPGTFSSGSFTITDDLTVLGTASITHLLVTTTSVIFSSGSTIFGDTLDDTHQFTGSVLVTGSVVADSFTGDGSGITGVVSASHAINADTASFVTASNVQGTVESASFAVTAAFALNAVAVESTSLAEKAKVAPMNISLNNFFGAEMKLRVPVVITEHDDGQRTLASLLGYTQARVIVRVTQAPTGSTTEPAGVVAVEGSLDDAAYVFLCGGSAGAGDGAPSASMSGSQGAALTAFSPWCDITGTLAVEDVFLRWVTYSGSDAGGNFRPRLASINLQVR